MLENILLILGTSFVIAIVLYSGIVATYRDLNSLEYVFLAVLGILVSAFISYFLGKKSLREEAKKGLEGEAKKALRRITVISESAVRIYRNVQEKLDVFTSASEAKSKISNELVHEYFYGIANQMKDLTTNIGASVEDWRDILPEEFKKLDEQNKKLAEAYEKAIQEKDEIKRRYQQDLKEQKKDKAEREALVRALRGELASTHEKYQAEIEKIKSEYASISGYGTTAPRLSELITLSDRVKLYALPLKPSDFLDDKGTVLQDKPKEKSEDNSSEEKIKGNSEEKEEVSKKDDGPIEVFLEEDSEKEEIKKKK